MTRLISEFDYSLPPELIAQRPPAHRDDSRMMVVSRRDGKILHARFRDFPEFMNEGEVLVLNNTRVIPAKAWGLKDGREVEFLFLREVDEEVWEVLCRPAKRVGLGDRIVFAPGAEAEVIETGHRGGRVLKFGGVKVRELLGRVGFAPLPPYIKRRRDQSDLRDDDLARYQTVFARREGSIAAPTAGLHFTRRVAPGPQEKGGRRVPGDARRRAGHLSDRRVRDGRGSQDARGKLRGERRLGEDPQPGKKRGAADRGGRHDRRADARKRLVGGRDRARLGFDVVVHHPGARVPGGGRLLTNFHLPRSTLLMLVSAFAGVEIIREAYAEAVRSRYRFFSYGDCMLIR